MAEHHLHTLTRKGRSVLCLDNAVEKQRGRVFSRGCFLGISLSCFILNTCTFLPWNKGIKLKLNVLSEL